MRRTHDAARTNPVTQPTPIRIVLVDDEPLARHGVRLLLSEDPDLLVVGEAADGPAAVEAIRTLAPDLILLDVQMPGMDGFEVLREVGPAHMPAVVFITAHEEFAVDAFEVEALDYLLKPFDDDRFRRTIERARRALRSVDLGELRHRLGALLDHVREGRGGEYAERITVREGGSAVFVRAAQIDWIEAADYYVRIHAGERTHLLRESLSSLERRLDPGRFFRVHRSAIVNLDRIREMQPRLRGDGLLTLSDGTRLKLSRSRRDELRRTLEQ